MLGEGIKTQINALREYALKTSHWPSVSQDNLTQETVTLIIGITHNGTHWLRLLWGSAQKGCGDTC